MSRPRSLPRQAADLARQFPMPHGMQFRPPRSRTGRTLLGVVGALVLILGAALLTDQEPVRAGSSAGTRVTVRSTVAVCQHPETLGDTRVAIAAPSAGPATGEAGAGVRAVKSGATVTEQGSKSRASLLRISEPGTTTYTDLATVPKQPLIASAAGAVAPGFAASLTTRTGGDANTRSLSGLPCPQAGTEFWFAGTGSNEKTRSSWLYLINPENAAAVVDVKLYSDDGPVEASGLDAIPIKPGQRIEKLLQVVASPHERIAVHVVARVGRVAAALYDHAFDGLQPRGTDWIAPVAAASSRLIVPAIPGGPGERTLYLFVPGDDGALARLKLIGKGGTFSPAPDAKAGALDTIALEGNQLKQISLSKVAGQEPFGVLIEADRPLIAAVRVGTGDSPPDIAYLAASPPLGGPSLVADARNAAGMTSKLVLTAPPGQPAKISIVALVKSEEPREVRDVEVKAGTSREISLSEVKGAFAIMITPLPGSGPIYASRVLSERSSDGDLLTIEQFQPSHTTAVVPDVVNDLSAGLRPGE